jgi:D-proline reductase (dithiol) PrdB
MVRLNETFEGLAKTLRGMETPANPDTPLIDGPPLAERRVAIISTAGLTRDGDRPFGMGGDEYRVIPSEAADGLTITHLSTNFDRIGFQLDTNVMFPLDRLNEMAEAGTIGSVADYHYSVMGATDPKGLSQSADQIAGLLKQDQVDAVLLVPV